MLIDIYIKNKHLILKLMTILLFLRPIWIVDILIKITVNLNVSLIFINVPNKVVIIVCGQLWYDIYINLKI